MTNKEFSNEFDVYLELDDKEGKLPYHTRPNEYEKSVLLTEALIGMFREMVESFEKNEKYRENLKSLIKREEVALQDVAKKGNYFYTDITTKDEDLYYRIREVLEEKDGSEILVKPTTYDELTRIKENPFRCPDKHTALRIDKGELTVQIISSSKAKSYIVDYLVEPLPIILADLEDDLYICGRNKATETNFSKALHDEILKRAVASYEKQL